MEKRSYLESIDLRIQYSLGDWDDNCDAVCEPLLVLVTLGERDDVAEGEGVSHWLLVSLRLCDALCEALCVREANCTCDPSKNATVFRFGSEKQWETPWGLG